MNCRVVTQQSFVIYIFFLACLRSVLPCRTCSNAHFDDKELERKRIEVVKQRILNKLRLDRPPNVVNSRRQLPRKLPNDVMMSMYADEASPVEEDYGMEEFYAKEGPTMIFADPGVTKCLGKGGSSVSCLTFTMPQILYKKSVHSAELYVHVKYPGSKHVFGIKDRTNDQDYGLGVYNLDASKEGWQSVHVKDMVARWIIRPSRVAPNPNTNVVQVSCDNCHSDIHTLISADGDYVPFLVINTENKKSHRNRRGIQCQQGSLHCCRESLYINFTDIGWDSWILEPRGYMANYCKGQCGGSGVINLPTFAHTAVVQSHSDNLATKARVDPPTSCCAPTRMSGLSLLFYDGDGAVHKSILPNMSVESCGCA
ncbi:inhibin beta C chain-like [Paramacrobiotus metropolitanus]|uniref:inhibin beta C chain-like n=1 Tax=Paramacrobiotus metropolitanus TaxID=2943436 RepID=UPI002445A0EA|nr:inhibin beta C chain-like [Paramacrobiotus metropolitanus]